MSKPILEATNISKSFGSVKALKDVSLTINKGEIRCLAGENGCGKSTIVKIIAGVLTPDTGKVTIDDKEYEKLTPIAAIKEGIQVIYQDLSLFQHMSVAENIAMNKMIYEKKKFVNKAEIYEIARTQLERIGVTLDLNESVGNLSIANRQLVAICRALALDAKVLFMDEPTTALTKKEVDRLFKIVLELKQNGLSVVFISHKLNEVFQIADTITIFRDGNKIGDFETKDLNEKSLSYHMTGREIEYPRYKREFEDENNLLEVKNLTKKGNYKDINFSLRKGDILGITGLLGAGRTELALSIFGLNKPDSGDILISGEKVAINSPSDAIKHKIALLPEDRTTQGLFLKQSMKNNVTSTILHKLKNKFGVIDEKKQEEVATESVNEINVNNKDIDLFVKNLSGGNAQKVVIGKWMVTDPEIFILDTPTVGIDIGSKSEIYDKIHAFAENGMGVILISDEIEEIVANSNKVLVMYDGEIIEYIDEEKMQEDDINHYIFDIINNPTKKVERSEIDG